MTGWLPLLCAVSALSCALVSGVFQAFSDFVMRALRKAEPMAGLEAMQIINREVFATFFMILLVAMSVASPIWIVHAATAMAGNAALAVIVAGSIYIVGVFGVTLIFNVPMNVRLDGQDRHDAKAQAYWIDQFYPRWTFWNHVRTVAAALSAIGYMLGCVALILAME